MRRRATECGAESEPGTLFICYMVDDVDAAVIRVRDAGGDAEEPTDEPYGRVASCTDDQGTPFAVFRPPGGRPGPRLDQHGTRQGDVAYITLEVVDSARGPAPSTVRCSDGGIAPGRVDDGWQVDDVRPGTGLHGGHDSATAVPMYRRRRHRGRGATGAGRGRHGIGPRSPALRRDVELRRRPGDPLLPGQL